MITIWRNAAAGKELTDCYGVQWCLLLLVELFINNSQVQCGSCNCGDLEEGKRRLRDTDPVVG